MQLEKRFRLNLTELFNQCRHWFSFDKGISEEETLLRTGKQVEMQGNWANLTFDVAAIKDSLQSLHFSVDRKSFSLIVPAKPILISKSSTQMIPAFRPTGVIANNRGKSG